MIFTPQNLIENISKLGAWSAYGLAIEALQYYFSNEYDINGDCKGGTQREAELVTELNLNSWQDVIIKYQNEVGYKCKEFNPQVVNEN